MAVFDDVALVYDETIDWESRLNTEMPFLLSTLGDPTGKRVLDIACGTGRHSIELAARGAVVTGIDVSTSMLERARELAAKKSVKCQFMEMDMSNLGDTEMGEFDLVLCLGNSLALSGSFKAVQSLLETIHSRLSKEGVLVAQVLNFEEIRKTGFRFFPVKHNQTAIGNTVVFFRFFDHCVTQGISDLVITTFLQEDSDWHMLSSVQPVLNLNEQSMNEALAGAGFNKVEAFSGYEGTPFNAKNDRNLVIRAHK